MNRRELITKTLKGEVCQSVPVTPHWWGLYKFAHEGLIKGYENEQKAWHLSGKYLADVDSNFYQSFKPDMFHLTTGPSLTTEPDAVRKEKEVLFKAVGKLDSYEVIDEYVSVFYENKDDVIHSGVFDHIQEIAERHGDDALLMLNEGNPVSWILDPNGCVGFVEGMMALVDKPDKMQYLLHKSYQALLPRMDALIEMGADGYIGSETYCAPDLISPDIYRNIIFEPQRDFYQAISKKGLIAVSYFLGDVNPIIEDLVQLEIDGLMIEESKKNFQIDVAALYQKIDGRVCLFGNLDSIYILQMGSQKDVEAETIRQLKACSQGHFIMANGCPISFETPAENILTMIETVKKHSLS